MSKFKILFQLSGSIAAYKSAYLISKLVQNEFEVQTVVTPSALEFIGKATLEGLTGKPVLIDQYEDGKMMNHINLIKWADLVLLCPATANTINKMANGIADNLVTALFLAHKFEKPYLVAPAMNTAMFNHPATRNSLSKLEEWGIEVMPTEAGHLACGDVGEGKLIDPDLIYGKIVARLESRPEVTPQNDSILITGGATREYIDGVRYISNLSTGRTAAVLADYLSGKGYNVTYLHGLNSILPENNLELLGFNDYKHLNDEMEILLKKRRYDFVIHSAAVSDYTVDKILFDDGVLSPAEDAKIESGRELSLRLKPTEKIVNKIKSFSVNRQVKLFAFKFSAEDDIDLSKRKVEALYEGSNADYIVLNHLKDRDSNGMQKLFYLFAGKELISAAEDPLLLAQLIERIIINGKEEK